MVDVDDEGDLGHTDLADLEFHPSSQKPPNIFRSFSIANFLDYNQDQASGKIPTSASSLFLFFSTLAPPRQLTLIDTGGFFGGSSGSRGNDPNSKRFLWSMEFYAQFFDVDTNEVLKRCWAALFPRANFLDVLDDNPDLYGMAMKDRVAVGR